MSKPPIRAVVARFTWPLAQKVFQEVLQKRPFEFCATIAVERHLYTGLPQEAQEFFASGEIRSCDYAGVDWNALTPVGADLIEAMRDTEDMFMDTVSRLEWKRNIPYPVRKRWYLQHLRFWNDYLTRKRINLFLSAWIPHEVPDVILYRLCRLRSIPTLYFHTSLMQDISFSASTWEDPAPRFGESYKRLTEKYKDVTRPEDIPLEPLFEKRYQSLIVEKAEKPAVERMHRTVKFPVIRQNPLTLLMRGIQSLTPAGIGRLQGALERRRVIRERNAFYDQHAVQPDMSKPFVYLALHFQPEASTTPMAGCFTDQLLVAQMLNACLPDDVLIYVKEHPRQSSWLKRTRRDYEELVAMKKVRLIARETDTFALRERCRAVATCSGSAGFEAIFRGKPVLLFGSRFYQYVHGVFRIGTTDGCRQAVRAIFERGNAPGAIDARIAMKATEESGVRATLHPLHLQVSSLTQQQHLENNVRAILDELAAREEEIASCDSVADRQYAIPTPNNA